MPGPIQPSKYSDRYSFDTRLSGGRYRDLQTGKVVSWETVRKDVDTRFIPAAENRMANLSVSLQDGRISLADWQRGMATEIKNLHGATAMTGKGGWARMTQSDWGKLGATVKEQRQYLQGFAVDIEKGKYGIPPTSGALNVRASMYAQAARGTGEEVRRADMADKGMTEEKRVLGIADHCQGCLEQAALGWQPIGTLDPIGAEECLTHCHCRFEYRPGPGEEPTGNIKRAKVKP
jgi:hypothetical protein